MTDSTTDKSLRLIADGTDTSLSVGRNVALARALIGERDELTRYRQYVFDHKEHIEKLDEQLETAVALGEVDTGTECHDEPTRFVNGVRGCSRCGVLWRASRYTSCVKCGGPASHEGRLPLDDLYWIPMKNPPPGPPTPPTPFTGPREVA